MAKLKSGKRARLPDSAFAYVDSRGGRRLPIHDKAHVRNALARFNQVSFESDAARERARARLLNAARKYRIVPVGFFTGQIRVEKDRVQATSTGAATLPTGFVTFVMTDIESSTGLLRRLGDRYGALLNDVRAILREAASRAGGREVDARADEFFAVFEHAPAAVEAAVAIQRELAGRDWTDGAEVRVRVGIHSGRPTLTAAGYIGLAVHTVARVCSCAHGGQIVVSAAARVPSAPRPQPGYASAASAVTACRGCLSPKRSSRSRPEDCAPSSRARVPAAARPRAARPPPMRAALPISSSCCAERTGLAGAGRGRPACTILEPAHSRFAEVHACQRISSSTTR